MTKADKKLGKIKLKEKELKSEVPTHGKKKKKKDPKSWEKKSHGCPFCGELLGKIRPDKPYWYLETVPNTCWAVPVENEETICSKCGAFAVEKACPACHRDTWFLPDDKTCTTGIYKHHKFDCGFTGRLKICKK